MYLTHISRFQMTELQKMRTEFPEAKALIFSQFAQTLSMIKTRLTAAGIAWRTITGDMNADQRERQIGLFNNDAAGSVFLLTMRTGAVGLTLTSATHVFLLDPALNPSLEQQASM